MSKVWLWVFCISFVILGVEGHVQVIDLTARCLWCHEDVTPHHYDSGFILYQPPAEYSALITTLRQYFSFYPLPASA